MSLRKHYVYSLTVIIPCGKLKTDAISFYFLTATPKQCPVGGNKPLTMLIFDKNFPRKSLYCLIDCYSSDFLLTTRILK